MSASPENIFEEPALTFGQWGERLAERYLNDHGFCTVARNYRTRGGEIDLICSDAQYLLFVEVKTRSGQRYGTAAEAVTRTKQRRIICAAQEYYYRCPTGLQPRFDVVEVYAPRDRHTVFAIHHIPNAFEVSE